MLLVLGFGVKGIKGVKGVKGLEFWVWSKGFDRLISLERSEGLLGWHVQIQVPYRLMAFEG